MFGRQYFLVDGLRKGEGQNVFKGPKGANFLHRSTWVGHNFLLHEKGGRNKIDDARLQKDRPPVSPMDTE